MARLNCNTSGVPSITSCLGLFGSKVILAATGGGGGTSGLGGEATAGASSAGLVGGGGSASLLAVSRGVIFLKSEVLGGVAPGGGGARGAILGGRPEPGSANDILPMTKNTPGSIKMDSRVTRSPLHQMPLVLLASFK